jgi:hypothetical protein
VRRTRHLNRGRTGFVATLVVGASLFAVACTGTAQERVAQDGSTTGRPALPAAMTVTLTSRQARHALLTEAYLGSQWTEAKDTADRRDSLLSGTVNAQDWLTHEEDAGVCQQLLDRLSGDDILGDPLGEAHATAVFNADDGNRLRYAVGTYPGDELVVALRWFAALPQKCGVFTATRPDHSTETVNVTSVPLPKGAGTRQALLVVAKGTTQGVPFTMSLDVALVTSGTSAITVVNGGLANVSRHTTQLAVRLGAPRLTTVQTGGTPPAQPTGLFD